MLTAQTQKKSIDTHGYRLKVKNALSGVLPSLSANHLAAFFSAHKSTTLILECIRLSYDIAWQGALVLPFTKWHNGMRIRLRGLNAAHAAACVCNNHGIDITRHRMIDRAERSRRRPDVFIWFAHVQ